MTFEQTGLHYLVRVDENYWLASAKGAFCPYVTPIKEDAFIFDNLDEVKVDAWKRELTKQNKLTLVQVVTMEQPVPFRF